MSKLSWKDVLYSRAPQAPWWGHMDEFRNMATTLGYTHYEWNGSIYYTLTGHDTGMTVDDVD